VSWWAWVGVASRFLELADAQELLRGGALGCWVWYAMLKGLTEFCYSLPTNTAGGMAWDEHGAAAAVEHLVGDEAGHTKFKDDAWLTFVGRALDDDDGPVAMLHRPDYTPPLGATPMMMMDHIPDVGTGAYDDVEKCLSMIHKVMIEKKGLKIVFVFGDQQVCA